MNLRDLEYVLALVDKRHFGDAARACHVSQPALSAQIKKLEQSLGIQLFERTPQGIIPTEGSRFVIENARVIIEKVSLIKKHAALLRDGHHAVVINLGVIPTIAPYYLSSFFKNISSSQATEEFRWQIVEEKTQVLIERIDAGRLDGAIMVLPPEGTRHPHKKLFEEPLFLATAKGSTLAKLKEIAPQDIREQDWLLLDDGHCLNDPMIEMCKRARNEIHQHSFRATSLETLRHMVASHSGVTLMPDMARRNDDGVIYVPLKDARRYSRSISLVWRNDSSVADQLARIAKEIASGNLT